MADLYADEDFHAGVVAELRQLGHDVLTAHEAGQANQGIPDSAVLAYAVSLARAVLTHNRKDFVRLHKQGVCHRGVIVVTNDSDFIANASRIDLAIQAAGNLDNQLVRVNKPSHP